MITYKLSPRQEYHAAGYVYSNHSSVTKMSATATTINNLRLLIMADDPLARAGLFALLSHQSDFIIVGQVDTASDLWSHLEVYSPDVILYDLGWDPASALERLSDIQESDLPLVLLLPNEAVVAEAWATGARGLLPRDADLGKLQAALLAAAQGLVTLDPEFTPSLLATPAPLGQLAEALTPRELEVLQHLAQGLPNKAIARRLDISEHTVKFHVNAIMSKLGAQSRTEAVVRATQLGLILL